MTLFQRTAYIKPHGIVEVPHVPGVGTYFSASLFNPPGVRKNNTYDGYGVYPLNDQGVVSVMAFDQTPPWGTPYTNAGYRVITKADGTMDPIPFMEAMSYLTVFGVRDEGLSQAQLDLIARSRPVEMRCGPTTQFIRNCAAQISVQMRQVHMLNVTQRNNFDDGHVAGEIKINNAWALWDGPGDVAFKDASSNWLSMAEVFSTGLDAVETVSLAETRCGAADYNLNPNWNQVYFEMKFRTPALAHEWRKRIYEVPGMFNPLTQGIVWGLKPGLWSYKAEVEAYSPLWNVIPFDEWVAAYY